VSSELPTVCTSGLLVLWARHGQDRPVLAESVEVFGRPMVIVHRMMSDQAKVIESCVDGWLDMEYDADRRRLTLNPTDKGRDWLVGWHARRGVHSPWS
jgi:hypothetical protein